MPSSRLANSNTGTTVRALAVGRADEVLKDVEKEGHQQEDEDAEDDEPIEHDGIGTSGVCPLGVGEEEGLPGVAEGLDEERHEDRELEAGAVDAELRHIGLIVVGQQVFERGPIQHLIDDPRQADDHHGQ